MWTVIRCSGMNHKEATKSGNCFHSIFQACLPGLGKRTTSATGQFENYPIRGKLCPFLKQTSLFEPSFGLVLYILVFLLGSAGYKLKSVMGSWAMFKMDIEVILFSLVRTRLDLPAQTQTQWAHGNFTVNWTYMLTQLVATNDRRIQIN